MVEVTYKKIRKESAYEIIIYSPIWVNDQLKKPVEEIGFIEKLCTLSLLGWITYTIYDDILDGDKDVEWLPVANVLNRIMEGEFAKLIPENINFYIKYQEIMKKLEEANLWEQKNCRDISKKVIFDSVEKISNKSMGHAITSLALLYKTNTNTEDVKRLENFYRYYLAARQMNDDAHDWEKDYKNNRVNSASATVLPECGIEDMEQLRIIFWEKHFENYAKNIFKYCDRAKKYIREAGCFINTELFDRMLDKVIKPTKKALKNKALTKKFINNYFKDEHTLY